MPPRREDPKRTARVASATTALALLRDGLTVLANLADGGINVPFVKGSAQIAIQLIDAVQTMKNNKDNIVEMWRKPPQRPCSA
ncbi:hypothetical protein NEOLEDRAFT_1176404 [Neolentinus lepideus HHB14362 ss-1]|uniref:Uncharacterized protein n=1 Tax=Neolentinus lepideus HHB14362 ss-1 TaxID=1314782 RepID=A0A165U8Z4_9AGAM|nr:hypothetical protein NEOLEDRAFT_1176404 [Neolentinus lepideus HHB14362 ss-1]